MEEDVRGLGAVYDTLIANTDLDAAYKTLKWESFHLPVSAPCTNQSRCSGHDFHTALLRGVIIPKKSGEYTFYMSGAADFEFGIGDNADVEDASPKAIKSKDRQNIGRVENNTVTTSKITLTAGQPHAFYALQWNVSKENGKLEWQGPGIDRQVIGEEYIFPLYDTVKPTAVSNLKKIAVGNDFALVKWDMATDNEALSHYNLC